MPARNDFGPEDLTPRALPHVVLVDIAPEGAEIRFRLVGTNHVTFNRRDFSKLTLEEVYPSDSPVLPYIRQLYRDLCERKRPLWSVNHVAHPRTGNTLMMKRLMLPLATDGKTVDMCLGIQLIETAAKEMSHPIAIWHEAPQIDELERRFL